MVRDLGCGVFWLRNLRVRRSAKKSLHCSKRIAGESFCSCTGILMNRSKHDDITVEIRRRIHGVRTRAEILIARRINIPINEISEG